MLSWSRNYNGSEYWFRPCKSCGLYTWLSIDRCAICEIHDIPFGDGLGTLSEKIDLNSMMEDCCSDG